MPEVSIKSTKDQILAAYQDVLAKLTEKKSDNPQEIRKKEEEQKVVSKASIQSPDTIISDLSSIKLKSIKQLDTLSEELLEEFQKLYDVREAILLEQKHLQDLYQINETAHTFSALLQAHREQKEYFEREMEQQKQEFEQSMTDKRLVWKEESYQLEHAFQEKRARLEKEYKREEEEYTYNLETKRRKESDEYMTQKALLEKELREKREELEKREADFTNKEQILLTLQAQVNAFPEQLIQKVKEAEEKLQDQLLQQHGFESQLKDKEYQGILKLYEQQVSSLETKIKEQEFLLKELMNKTDQAMQQVQLIACRALDASSHRFAVSLNQDEKSFGAS